MLKKIKERLVVMFLAIAMTLISIAPGIQSVYASSESENNLKLESDILSESELSDYKGIDLLDENVNLRNLSNKENELFNILIEDALRKNGIYTNKEYYKGLIIDLLEGNESIENTTNYYEVTTMASNHGLVSVKVFGTALDFAISAGIVSLGYGGIRALISHLGKKQAERLVRSVVIDKVRSVLFKYGFSSAASWITNGAVEIIISGILEPGAAIARWVDSRDKISNNGYIELW